MSKERTKKENWEIKERLILAAFMTSIGWAAGLIAGGAETFSALLENNLICY